MHITLEEPWKIHLILLIEVGRLPREVTPGHHILFIGHRRDLVQLALTKLTMTCIIDCSDCLFHQAVYISLIPSTIQGT